MKNTIFKIILLLLIIISIPVSFYFSLAVGATMKYETELGEFPSYIDPADIPNNPEEQKTLLKEIHENLLLQYNLLKLWWIPAGILLVILFFYSIKHSADELL